MLVTDRSIWRTRLARWCVVAACCTTCLVTGRAWAESASLTPEPPPRATTVAGARVGSDIEQLLPPPAVSADAWLVHDAITGETVAAHNPSEPRPIASLAKLMTALVAIDVVQPDDDVKITNAVNSLPSDAAAM
ncbi:MAG: D-alanyl-D-alanine carboxypeptidase, partial [Thermoleophilia bacterium]|nr:D-alanyl-D-alanine carboxypeptidase [Thermoleophilia bacterium]